MPVIKIRNQVNEPILIDAEVSGDFAIHKTLSLNEYGYTVSYLPAAAKIFSSIKKEVCEAFVEEVLKLDWAFVKKMCNDFPISCKHYLDRGQAEGFNFESFDKIRNKLRDEDSMKAPKP